MLMPGTTLANTPDFFLLSSCDAYNKPEQIIMEIENIRAGIPFVRRDA